MKGWYWPRRVFSNEVMSQVKYSRIMKKKKGNLFPFSVFSRVRQNLSETPSDTLCSRLWHSLDPGRNFWVKELFLQISPMAQDLIWNTDWMFHWLHQNVFHMKTLYVTSWQVPASWKGTRRSYSGGGGKQQEGAGPAGHGAFFFQPGSPHGTAVFCVQLSHTQKCIVTKIKA